ncbi:MAG: insulinase family protein [Eubacteriales bacterium]|nr:insulinase family protein [Eubacteriales bacterium]
MQEFLKRYELLEECDIPECGGKSYIYRHIRSGARIFTLKNKDKNKVFYIGFRTTPQDDTGVAHILEHSVLCGSEKFPLKDPFVELAKGSLNTFLNAMTYPDKTVYPVASCNDRDFMNLMDVYLDAVLHPKIYSEKRIFEQEGWHYELSPEDGSLSYNGVVYNEMKGAFSNPDSVLERYTMHTLFPDTTYGFESGGDPEAIPSLSYEAFLDFHKRYYHPSNSYIYLYGDMDMEEKLLWMDEQYLSAYDREEIRSEIGVQQAFSAPRSERIFYPLGANEETVGRTWFSENYVIADVPDARLNLAWQVLEFILLDAPGAPLREALIKAGIGEDILGGYTYGLRQPYFSVTAKNADAEDEARFHTVVRETLSGIVKNGIDRKFLRAALNYMEFKYREADYGRLPQGLAYGLTALESWLYDGKPYTYLKYKETLAFLKEQADTGYFETLLSKALIDNPHRADVTVIPKQGLTAERDAALKARLAGVRASLSDEAVSEIAEEEKRLRAYQEEPVSEADMQKLPLLRISDIGREAEKNCMQVCADKRLLWSRFNTNGIAYIRVLFETDMLSEEELQFASFLRYLYGELDTKKRSYQELTSEILEKTGGIDFEIGSFPDVKNPGAYRGFFSAELRILSENMGEGLSLVSEILNESLFTDEKHIGEKLLEAKSRMQMKLDGSSHSAAVTRAGSYFRADQRYEDVTGGIAFYDFLNAASKFYQIPGKRRHFIASLQAVARKLFVKKQMTLALSGERQEKLALMAHMKAFVQTFPAAKAERNVSEAELGRRKRLSVHAQGKVNEGFLTTSQVNYVARCGSFADAGLPYTGALIVLKGFLNYEYLWQRLRVKGGAYGCMSGFVKSGRGYLVSYRDPQVGKTDGVYEALPDYLGTLALSERDMTKYIIGAIAELDQPLSASIRASRYLSAYFSGITDGDFRKERDEVLGCTCETLKGLKPYVEAVLAGGYRCAIGNAEKIRENEKLFASVRELY